MSQPLLQGHMDQLCGVYAVLNALRLMIGQRFDEDMQQAVFDMLLDRVGDRRPLSEVLWEGIKFRRLGELIDLASEQLAKNLDLQIQRSGVARSRTHSLAHYWSALSEHIDADQGRVAIIRLNGRHDHWTVVQNLTGKRIGLSDSLAIKWLNRANCSVPDDPVRGIHEILPNQTYLLSLRRDASQVGPC